MNGDKVEKFMMLAGQAVPMPEASVGEKERILGAHLLLSEVLEYVIKGLGVTPVIDGTPITDPEKVAFTVTNNQKIDKLQMLDGLADVAYTMYWNAHAFNVPLEEGYDLVCDNNLEKFVRLDGWSGGKKKLASDEWHCGREVKWPAEVAQVETIQVASVWYAVGKDARGKVRKPSTYKSVDLTPLLEAA